MRKLKKINWPKIFRFFALLIFIAGFTTSFVYSTIERKKARCNELSVNFAEDFQFISSKKIENIILAKSPQIMGCRLDTLETDWIEKEIEKLAWVKRADIFKSYGIGEKGKMGLLKIKITQHTPLFRVQNEKNGYYIGVEKNKLPLSSLHTKRVVVVTGKVNKAFVEGDLFTFIENVEKNRFWKAQIEQIHVTAKNELVLVPRVGSHLIEFGPATDMDRKFRNMEAIYKYGFDDACWRKYKTVSLKYENQVICTLK